jgi:hypothetical protein
MGYQVKAQSSTQNSRPPSHYTFPQPTSPKSPVNFVQYHQQRREYPPVEVEYDFPRTASRSKTRHGRNFRSLDFEVGLRDDNASSCSEAPPYHQYPEEDQWEGRGRRREREPSKADVGVVPWAMDGDAPRPSMAVLEAWQRRATEANPPPRVVMALHPYVCTLASMCGNFRTDLRDCRSPLLRLPLVSHLESNEHRSLAN